MGNIYKDQHLYNYQKYSNLIAKTGYWTYDDKFTINNVYGNWV